jgi:hypothetical protein
VTEGEKPRPVQEKENSCRGQLELFAGGDAHGHCGTRRDLLVQAGLAAHVSHAIGLGYDIRYAPRLVHSDDLDSPASPHRPGLQARRAVNGETPPAISGKRMVRSGRIPTGWVGRIAYMHHESQKSYLDSAGRKPTNERLDTQKTVDGNRHLAIASDYLNTPESM